MSSSQNNILNKIIELREQPKKVELGLMQDVMTSYKALVKVKDIMDGDLAKAKKSAVMGDTGIKNFNKLAGDVEKAAKELGIPVGDTNLQKLYSEIKDMAKDFDKVIKA